MFEGSTAGAIAAWHHSLLISVRIVGPLSLVSVVAQSSEAARSINSALTHQAEVLQQLEAQLQEARQQQVEFSWFPLRTRAYLC